MKVSIEVKPGSKKGPLVEKESDGSLAVYVREKAIEGAANEAVIELLAEHFNVSKGRVRIISGAKSRSKVVEIEE